jgi:hypothetical protein
VSDENGTRIATERLVEGNGIGRERSGLVAAVVGHGSWRVPAHERCNRVVAGVGEAAHQRNPRMGSVGKAMQAQGQWSGSQLETRELDSSRMNDSHGGLDG